MNRPVSKIPSQTHIFGHKPHISKPRVTFSCKYPTNTKPVEEKLLAKSEILICNQNEKSLLYTGDKLCTNDVASLVHLHNTFKPWPKKLTVSNLAVSCTTPVVFYLPEIPECASIVWVTRKYFIAQLNTCVRNVFTM